MGSRDRRKARARLAAEAEQAMTAGSVEPEAGAETVAQSDSASVQGIAPGGGGQSERLDNGLTPIKDARLALKAFSWRREQRVPTRIPATEIIKAAAAEGRGLTPLETSIVNATALAGSSSATERGRLAGIKLILAAERANQLDDHAKAKRPTGAADAGASGNSAVPPGTNVTIQNIGAQNVAVVDGGTPDAGRSRFLDLRDRLRNRGIVDQSSGSGQGSDPGRIDQAVESA